MSTPFLVNINDAITKATNIAFIKVINPIMGNRNISVYSVVHFPYPSMQFLNLLNEYTVCPNVLTTGTPLTYSVASELIVSRASWYSFIFFCILGPIINIMHANPKTAGTIHISPIFQLNAKTSIRRPTGVTAATVLSASV